LSKIKGCSASNKKSLSYSTINSHNALGSREASVISKYRVVNEEVDGGAISLSICGSFLFV
jgi:hypothetical protein